MVLEFLLGDDTWTAIACASLPKDLDDAIEANLVEFNMAARNLSNEELIVGIPKSFEMDPWIYGFPGVARYPVEEWEAEGFPIMPVISWARLCKRVAVNDPDNLQDILETAQKYGADD